MRRKFKFRIKFIETETPKYMNLPHTSEHRVQDKVSPKYRNMNNNTLNCFPIKNIKKESEKKNY